MGEVLTIKSIMSIDEVLAIEDSKLDSFEGGEQILVLPSVEGMSGLVDSNYHEVKEELAKKPIYLRENQKIGSYSNPDWWFGINKKKNVFLIPSIVIENITHIEGDEIHIEAASIYNLKVKDSNLSLYHFNTFVEGGIIEGSTFRGLGWNESESVKRESHLLMKDSKVLDLLDISAKKIELYDCNLPCKEVHIDVQDLKHSGLIVPDGVLTYINGTDYDNYFSKDL